MKSKIINIHICLLINLLNIQLLEILTGNFYDVFRSKKIIF
jgi:hypothetical protein